MPKRKPNKKRTYHITSQTAHQRAVEAWRTKHLRYQYGHARYVKHEGDAPDEPGKPLPEGTDAELGETKHEFEEIRTKQGEFTSLSGDVLKLPNGEVVENIDNLSAEELMALTQTSDVEPSKKLKGRIVKEPIDKLAVSSTEVGRLVDKKGKSLINSPADAIEKFPELMEFLHKHGYTSIETRKGVAWKNKAGDKIEILENGDIHENGTPVVVSNYNFVPSEESVLTYEAPEKPAAKNSRSWTTRDEINHASPRKPLTVEELYARDYPESVDPGNMGFLDSWKARHKFKRSQQNTLLDTIRNGKFHRGFSLTDTQGNFKIQSRPPDKASVGIRPDFLNAETTVTTMRYVPTEEGMTQRPKLTMVLPSPNRQSTHQVIQTPEGNEYIVRGHKTNDLRTKLAEIADNPEYKETFTPQAKKFLKNGKIKAKVANDIPGTTLFEITGEKGQILNPAEIEAIRKGLGVSENLTAKDYLKGAKQLEASIPEFRLETETVPAGQYVDEKDMNQYIDVRRTPYAAEGKNVYTRLGRTGLGESLTAQRLQEAQQSYEAANNRLAEASEASHTAAITRVRKQSIETAYQKDLSRAVELRQLLDKVDVSGALASASVTVGTESSRGQEPSQGSGMSRTSYKAFQKKDAIKYGKLKARVEFLKEQPQKFRPAGAGDSDLQEAQSELAKLQNQIKSRAEAYHRSAEWAVSKASAKNQAATELYETYASSDTDQLLARAKEAGLDVSTTLNLIEPMSEEQDINPMSSNTVVKHLEELQRIEKDLDTKKRILDKHTAAYEEAVANPKADEHDKERAANKAKEAAAKLADVKKLQKEQRESADILTVKGPKGQVLYYHAKEPSSDAIGWGKSWRPGEKELQDLAFAVPRTRQRHALENALATYAVDEQAGVEKLDDLILQSDPNITNDELNARREQLIKHGKELVAAGGAAGFYAAKRSAKVAGGTHAYEKFYTKAADRSEWFRNRQFVSPAEMREASQIDYKLARAKFRIAHPLSPLTSEGEMEGATWGWNRIAPPKWRHRRQPTIFSQNHEIRVPGMSKAIPIKANTKEDRLVSRLYEPAENYHALVNRHLERLEQDPENLTRLEKSRRKLALHELVRLEPQRQMHLTKMFTPEGGLQQIFGDALEHSTRFDKAQLIPRFEELQKGGLSSTQQEALNAATAGAKRDLHDIHILPKGVAPGLLGAGLLGAAAIHHYDQKHHGYNRVLENARKGIPETVNIPKTSIAASKTYTIPHNNFAEALDIGGREIPVGWRASLTSKQIRLRNHKDITKEPYKPGPLVGKISLRAPVPNDGSLLNSIYYAPQHQGKTKYAAPEKNLYVGGKRVPVNVEIGKKERWNEPGGPKKFKLSRANPNKLSNADIDKLAFIATHDSDPAVREQIHNFYADDPRYREVINDELRMYEIGEKHETLLKPTPSVKKLSENQLAQQKDLKLKLEDAIRGTTVRGTPVRKGGAIRSEDMPLVRRTSRQQAEQDREARNRYSREQ